MESGLSWSSNPLARTQSDELLFTTPDGPVVLPLLSKPQQAALASVSLARTHAGGGFEVQLQGADLSGATAAARLAAWGHWPWAPVSAGLQWSMLVQQGLDGARRHTAGLSWTGKAARWSVFRYLEPELNDRGLLARLEAPWAGPAGLQGLAHVERAASTSKDQGAWKAGLTAQASWPSQLKLQLQWTGQLDTHGYSPLLANGALRWLSSLQWSAEKSIDLSSGKTLSIRALTTQRRSNIELFASREAALQFQLIQMWR
jgi:hypothetical protein